MVQYFNFFRDLCSWKLVEEADRFMFGGTGCVVQIDESVVTRRKYNRGRVVKEKWVLGIYDTSLRRGVVLYVCRRDRQTLVPIIQDYVLPGTTIYTDGWPAYGGLNRAAYVHMVVNHKDNFVDPTTGACTNAVEGYWAKLKRFLRQTDTMKSRRLPEHMDEFMWRDAYCEDDNVFKKIVEVIRELYRNGRRLPCQPASQPAAGRTRPSAPPANQPATERTRLQPTDSEQPERPCLPAHQLSEPVTSRLQPDPAIPSMPVLADQLPVLSPFCP
ncbi:hypothetical protein C0J52_11733 [Blattella germanica]|nr:hypothetical protein C0J52_11733 [Blattella germanica]